MKNRIQLTLPLLLAVLFSVLWFAFWLTSFRPAPVLFMSDEKSPTVTLWNEPADALPELQPKPLFAYPFNEGFSGTFPENQIQTPLQLSNPSPPDFYLTRQPSQPSVNPQQNLGEIELPVEELPIPGLKPHRKLTPSEGITLFFSNDLEARLLTPVDLDISGDLPDSLRVNLSVSPEGTVSKLFFANPVENAALAGALRRLRFAPAPEPTDGWLELRIIQKGEDE